MTFFLIFFYIIDLVGSNVRVNLTAGEIRRLADRIIGESNKAHDALAAVPLDKIPMSVRPLSVSHVPAPNSLDANQATASSQSDLAKQAPPHARSLMSDSNKLQDELEKVGGRVKHREENIKYLNTLKHQVDDAILDLHVTLRKYHSSIVPKTEDEIIVDAQSEEKSVEQIVKHDKSAAGIFYQLKRRQGSLVSNLTLSQEVLGAVALLGKVNDDNLSRLFSEYLGLQTMLTIVCKSYEGVKSLEGLANADSGIRGLGNDAIGQILQGRSLVICLDYVRPYAGEIIADDPQRRLDIPKPRLPNGALPNGFLGFAVNMIHVDRTHLYSLTSSGCGLRETLFYHLFSRLQVYQTKEKMLDALPCISDGAVSLDGGIMKTKGVFSLGSREDVDVRFPAHSNRLTPAEDCRESENKLKQKIWESERIQDDIRREQALLAQEMNDFSKKKEYLLKFLAESSSYLSQLQMQTTSRERHGSQY